MKQTGQLKAVFFAVLAAVLYAISAPFVGAGLSLLIFWEKPSWLYLTALAIMILGTYFATIDGRPKRKMKKVENTP